MQEEEEEEVMAEPQQRGQQDCPICLSPLALGEIHACVPCGHPMHGNCAMQLYQHYNAEQLQRHPQFRVPLQCPMCNVDVKQLIRVFIDVNQPSPPPPSPPRGVALAVERIKQVLQATNQVSQKRLETINQQAEQLGHCKEAIKKKDGQISLLESTLANRNRQASANQAMVVAQYEEKSKKDKHHIAVLESKLQDSTHQLQEHKLQMEGHCKEAIKKKDEQISLLEKTLANANHQAAANQAMVVAQHEEKSKKDKHHIAVLESKLQDSTHQVQEHKLQTEGHCKEAIKKKDEQISLLESTLANTNRQAAVNQAMVVTQYEEKSKKDKHHIAVLESKLQDSTHQVQEYKLQMDHLLVENEGLKAQNNNRYQTLRGCSIIGRSVAASGSGSDKQHINKNKRKKTSKPMTTKGRSPQADQPSCSLLGSQVTPIVIDSS